MPQDKKDALVAYEKAAADARKKAEVSLYKSLTDEYQDYADAMRNSTMISRPVYYTDKRAFMLIEKKFNDDIAALRAERGKYVDRGDTAKVEKIDRAIAQATKGYKP